ncbi:CU044_2847 family protein [Micromonospora sp. NPDC004704]
MSGSRQPGRDALTAIAPDEMEVEFGLKLSSQFGVVLTKGTAEVNIVVRMKWSAQA